MSTHTLLIQVFGDEARGFHAELTIPDEAIFGPERGNVYSTETMPSKAAVRAQIMLMGNALAEFIDTRDHGAFTRTVTGLTHPELVH